MSYERVLERISAAALRAGRSPEEVTLVVVTKNQPLEAIQAVYEQGARQFGENRVQELLAKKPLLPSDIQWHLIGHLQTNKVKAVLPHIKLLHSLDRESLLEEIRKRAVEPIPCLIEVKIAQEPTKHGVFPEMLMSFAEKVLSEPKVQLRGLMGMATFTSDRAQIRREFRTLYRLFEELRRLHPAADTLSMGMSQDFEIAIEEGSTLVRVGTAVFEP
jgi:pyridoxal phosphate enzyme (YggS family)